MIPLFRFLFHTPYWEPRIVLETVLPLCCFFLDLQFPLHKLFSEKNYPRIISSDLYLYTSHFQKKNKTEKLTSKGSARWQRHIVLHGSVQISPSNKSQLTLSSVKCTAFVLFDYAESISFRTINC